jgi:hypothetical protein
MEFLVDHCSIESFGVPSQGVLTLKCPFLQMGNVHKFVASYKQKLTFSVYQTKSQEFTPRTYTQSRVTWAVCCQELCCRCSRTE